MNVFEQLAPLFRYPDAEYRLRVQACAATPGLEMLAGFASEIASLDSSALQERFVDAFDLRPASTLDLGWHLFGERYERGAWLAELRAELQRAGCDDSSELPDHLTQVLTLLGRLDSDRAASLARIVGPAIESLHEALVRDGSPFRHALAAVRASLDAVGTASTSGDRHA